MNPKWDEEIIVVNRKDLFNYVGSFQGFNSNLIDVHNLNENITFNREIMRRGNEKDPTPKENNAEINMDYKQPIPYAIIKAGSKIFTYERLNQGGEERLHNKLSVGLGGHMNRTMGTSWEEILLENLKRELNEELEIISQCIPKLEILGYINDDSNDVGKVHIGVLVLINYSNDTEINVKETDQLKGDLLEASELLKTIYYDRLENWSKIAIKELML